jgi:aconitate hydratase
MANLINSGILPMTFADEADYDMIKEGDVLVLENTREQIKAGSELIVENRTANLKIKVNVALSDRQAEIILAGGLLNYTRKQGG